MSPRAHPYSLRQESETHADVFLSLFAQPAASCKQATGQGRPVRQRTSHNRLGRTASGAIRAPWERRPSWDHAPAKPPLAFSFFLRDSFESGIW